MAQFDSLDSYLNRARAVNKKVDQLVDGVKAARAEVRVQRGIFPDVGHGLYQMLQTLKSGEDYKAQIIRSSRLAGIPDLVENSDPRDD